jgi:hypothetical protein
MFKLFPALNLIVLFFALNVQSEVETEKTLIASDDVPVNSTEVISKTSDYIFDTPDVVKEYTREDGTRVRLDAYQTKNNNGLMQTGQNSGLR